MILSIIIPAFNAEAFIGRCLESIISQPFSDLEIIVIDDGSSDRTLAICQDYSRIDNRIVVLSHPNQGVSVSRNVGLSNACGEYIWFVDADDFISPNSITYLITTVVENNLDLLQFNWHVFNSSNQLLSSTVLSGSSVLSFSNYLLKNYFKGVLWQSIIKHECIGSVRFSETVNLWEDGLFFMQLFSSIKVAQRVTFKAYNYFQNDLSITHNIPFGTCMKVSSLTNDLTIPSFAYQYRESFIAFYSALSLFSNDYNESFFINYISSEPLAVKNQFYTKLLQNCYTYNYGLLKGLKSLDARMVVLNRIKLIISRSDDRQLNSGFIFNLFKYLPIQLLDFLLNWTAPLIKIFYFRK